MVARLVAPDRAAARLGERVWSERIERLRTAASESIARHGGQPIDAGAGAISARFERCAADVGRVPDVRDVLSLLAGERPAGKREEA